MIGFQAAPERAFSRLDSVREGNDVSDCPKKLHLSASSAAVAGRVQLKQLRAMECLPSGGRLAR
jgi:hypothetical protein